MAGHNKWSKVKRLKAVTDSRKGKVFSRLSRDITLAAKSGGGDPEGNARFRTLVLKARDANMPADNALSTIPVVVADDGLNLRVYAGAERAKRQMDRKCGQRALVDVAVPKVGTFALDPFDSDAALVVILPPGAYTVHVTDKATTSGVTLVEVYDLE